MIDTVYTIQPSEDGEHWYVWNIYEPLPPKPVFVGSMEEAYGVSDALNKREWDRREGNVREDRRVRWGTITIVDGLEKRYLGRNCYYIACDHPGCDAVIDRKPIEMNPNYGDWREVPQLMAYARSQGWSTEERAAPHIGKNRFITYCPLHRSDRAIGNRPENP